MKRYLVVILGFLLARANFASDPQPPAARIEGLWSGADTNDSLPSAFLCIKLATNGQGAFISGGFVAIPGTFTYTLSQGRVDYVTNSTVQLRGTLSYNAATDSLIYQAKPARASRTREAQGPVVMSRDADELKDAILGLVLGATSEQEVMTRLKPVFATLRGVTNYDDAITRLKPVLGGMSNRIGTAPTGRFRPSERPGSSTSATNRQELPATNR